MMHTWQTLDNAAYDFASVRVVVGMTDRVELWWA